jgi:membrane dipeptidase
MEKPNSSRTIKTVDLHVDAPWKWWKYGIDNQTELHIDIPVFAIYLPDAVRDHAYAVREQIEWCTNKGIKNLSIEGGRLVNVELLPDLHELGVRYITLMHNFDNEIGGSSLGTATVGLSKRGIDLVKEIERVGIVPDISHANDNTAWDVISYSDGHVIASHSGCRGLVAHSRNLSDELIKYIALRDGVVGVPFVRKFLGWPRYTVADHIDYIVQLVGIDHVAIGSDIDGAITIGEASEWRGVVIDTLLERGYSIDDIAAVVGGNATRVLGLQ